MANGSCLWANDISSVKPLCRWWVHPLFADGARCVARLACVPDTEVVHGPVWHGSHVWALDAVACVGVVLAVRLRCPGPLGPAAICDVSEPDARHCTSGCVRALLNNVALGMLRGDRHCLQQCLEDTIELNRFALLFQSA